MESRMTGELWTVIGLLLTNAAFLFGMWRYFDGRISRVYERLDEVKMFSDGKFVEKDMCKVLHDQGSLATTGLETRLSIRMDKLENKFDRIIDLLTKEK
jgi:hypothetical protein